jgi:Lon protease-like protein
MRLPLQLFEERYVAMLHYLIDSQGEQSGFGVVAIQHGYEVGDRENELYSVGTLAVLDRVVQVNPSLFLVLTHGTRRFRLDAVDETAGTLWTTGQVTWLQDFEVDPARTQNLAMAVRQEAHVLGITVGRDLPPAPSDPAFLAYWAAEALDLDRDDRQRLLELSDIGDRLGLVRRIAQREAALATELGVTGGPTSRPPSLN